MPRNLRLARAKDFDEVANAHFLVPHKVQESQARAIRERPKQRFHVHENKYMRKSVYLS